MTLLGICAETRKRRSEDAAAQTEKDDRLNTTKSNKKVKMDASAARQFQYDHCSLGKCVCSTIACDISRKQHYKCLHCSDIKTKKCRKQVCQTKCREEIGRDSCKEAIARDSWSVKGDLFSTSEQPLLSGFFKHAASISFVPSDELTNTLVDVVSDLSSSKMDVLELGKTSQGSVFIRFLIFIFFCFNFPEHNLFLHV